jgi:hypothetical protein
MISVLAKQNGNGFTSLTAKNGYEVELATVGNHSAAELIEGKRKSEALLTWILRAVGTGMMFLGFAMCSRRFQRSRRLFRFSVTLREERRRSYRSSSRCRLVIAFA